MRLECRVLIRAEDRDDVLAEVHDLSRGGIQLRCGVDAARELVALLPGPEGLDAGDLAATLELHTEGAPLVLEAVCRRRHVTRTGGDRIAMGFEFLSLSPASREALNAFIERALAPE